MGTSILSGAVENAVRAERRRRAVLDRGRRGTCCRQRSGGGISDLEMINWMHRRLLSGPNRSPSYHPSFHYLCVTSPVFDEVGHDETLGDGADV
jgi:hypothetical protein